MLIGFIITSIQMFRKTHLTCFFYSSQRPSVTHQIMKGQQAFGEVTHALMRKHLFLFNGLSLKRVFMK